MQQYTPLADFRFCPADLQAPDPEADVRSDHFFSYALMPHSGSLQESGVVAAAAAFNAPLRIARIPAVLSLDHPMLAGSFVEVGQ